MTDFAIAPASLHRLRRRLAALAPDQAAAILHDAGFATGEALAAAWDQRIAERTGLADAGALDTRWFGPLLDELCVTLGWGSLTVTDHHARAITFESGDWAEAEPGSEASAGCHFTSGCLAAFLTIQAGTPIGVLEVTCRTAGDETCRFVAASEPTLAAIVDVVAAGGAWEEAVGVEGKT